MAQLREILALSLLYCPRVRNIVRGDNQGETAATIWMRLLCRGRHESIMLIVAGKSLIQIVAAVSS